MLISYSISSIKLIHLNYPDICIIIINSFTKMVTVSIGIMRKEFKVSELSEHLEFLSHFLEENILNRITQICEAVKSGAECDRKLIQQLSRINDD